MKKRAAKPREKKVGSIRRLLRLLYFAPLTFLFLERLWIPFEYQHISSYLHVETTAASTSKKSSRFEKAVDIPRLDELTATHSWAKSCSKKTTLVTDVYGAVTESVNDRKIPRIVHQTAKTRCLTPAFVEATKQWRLPGWSYHFHDDDAMNRLLRIEFADFPHLKSVIRNCVSNGTLKADLWRYLVLWVYGGVYADFDSAPNEFNANSINDVDDGFFVVEQYHILSQWFMAVSPRHPLMYYAIQHSLLNLLEAEDTMKIGAHLKTGPHALHKAFQDFRRDAGVMVDPLGTGFKPVKKGKFLGTSNRTITVAGFGENENQYVQRLAVDQITRTKDYREMGMIHFSRFTQPKAKKSGMTCFDAMLKDVSAAIH